MLWAQSATEDYIRANHWTSVPVWGLKLPKKQTTQSVFQATKLPVNKQFGLIVENNMKIHLERGRVSVCVCVCVCVGARGVFLSKLIVINCCCGILFGFCLLQELQERTAFQWSTLSWSAISCCFVTLVGVVSSFSSNSNRWHWRQRRQTEYTENARALFGLLYYLFCLG